MVHQTKLYFFYLSNKQKKKVKNTLLIYSIQQLERTFDSLHLKLQVLIYYTIELPILLDTLHHLSNFLVKLTKIEIFLH